MAHVSNGYQQAPALAAPDLDGLAIHGIVKVAGILAVDGDEWNIREIDAPALIERAHRVGQRLGLRQTGLRKLMRHAIFAHRDLHLHAGIVHLAQHFDHAPHGLTKQGRRLGQLHHHHLAGGSGSRGALGDQYVLAVALVLGGHQPNATFLQQPADDGLRWPFNDLQHTPLGPTTLVLAHDAHTHPILVQHGAHFVGGNVDVRLTIIANDEPMPVTVTLHGALDLIRRNLRRGRAGVFFFAIQSISFLKCPGGGIGRRTSFRY